MIKVLSRTSIVWDAALLGAAILITIVAGAYHLTEAATLGAGAPLARYHVADELDANPGDGSIIIECMALGDRASAEAREARDATTPLLVTLPRYQLGPSRCWHGEHNGS
jgi:hypothetical protein